METLKKNLNDSKYLKWIVLVLVGFVLFTNYYFYDAFSPLFSLLRSEFGFTNTQYGFFSSAYSIPNTFLAMAVIGGIILDRFGVRPTGFMFISFMTFGALLTAYGASDMYRAGGFGYTALSNIFPQYSPELKMMLIGRFFYGLGAETSIVVISKILVKWFKGKNLALAFGLKVGFGRLGTFLALRIQPSLVNAENGLNVAIWFAGMLVLIGLLVFIVYMVLDIKLDKQILQKNKISEKDKFKFSDIVGLLSNKGYLYIALICVTFYSAVFPFNQFAPDFFLNKFGVSLENSGKIASWMPAATAAMTPLIGIFIDRIGKGVTLMIYGSLILLVVHLSFAFTMFSPYVLMILLGIAFSLVPASMWPTMVSMVKDSQIGTAYGLMYSIQNLGLWGFPILAGVILDATNPGDPEVLNYTYVILMFASLGLLGLFFSLMLKRNDKKYGLGVDQPLNKK
ncbi:MAG: MFS transporter [Bacteroidales bacterium]|nr:MFS transporter [Bacteroidales bacterium]